MMALLEDILGGWGGIAVGVGAVIVFPAIAPVVVSVARPAAKALIKGSLVLSDQVSSFAGSASSGLRQFVAEVQADSPRKTSAATARTARA